MIPRGATVTQCVVPQPDWRPCGDRPLLAWVLREFIRFGVTECLLPAGPETTAESLAALQAKLPRTVRMVPVAVPWEAGDAILQHAGDALQDRFLLCRGQVPPDGNFADLLAAAARDQGGAMAWATGDGQVALLDRNVLRPPGSADLPCDDAVAALAWSGRIRGEQVQAALVRQEPSAAAALADTDSGRARTAVGTVPNRWRRRALFLDRDGVLNVDHGYVGTRDRFEWTDGALAAIRCATEAGWHVFIVTNQSGVARGLYGEDAVIALLDWMADQARAAGGTVDDARFCPFHPDAAVAAYRQAHPWRKPLPGMLLDLIERWEVDPARAVMIGDQETDMRAAAAAGVTGHLFTGGNLLSFLRPILAGPA